MLFISILIFILSKALLSMNERLPYNFFIRISAIVLLFCAVLTFNTLYFKCLESGIGIYNGLFHVNIITQLMEIFLFLIGSIILIAWPIKNKNYEYNVEDYYINSNLTNLNEGYYFNTDPKEKISNFDSYYNIVNISNETNKNNDISIESYTTNYSILILFNCLGASLMISSYDLISMYLSIELQSFSLYVLTSLYKDSELSTSAGLKYFLLGGFSSCLILLGAGLIYAFTGLTDFESIYTLISVRSSDINNLSLFNTINDLTFPVLDGGFKLNDIQLIGLGQQESSLTISNLENNSSVKSIICTDSPSPIRDGSEWFTFYLGLIIIFVGFLFKIAAAPLHNWSPDVYDESPTIITIWLTIMPKISILLFLLEILTNLGSFYYITSNFSNNTAPWIHFFEGLGNNSYQTLFENSFSSNVSFSPFGLFGNENIISYKLINSFNNTIKDLLLISSLLSLIIGSVVGLVQKRIKRLLAYSTISHVGFILLGLAIQTEQSINSFLFYIIQYSITNLNIFLIVIALSYLIKNKIISPSAPNNKKEITPKSYSNGNSKEDTIYPFGIVSKITDIRYISELKDQLSIYPIITLSLSICLFSMAGIPPLIGFFSKLFVLYSSIQSGYYFISLIAIIVSIISAYYYLNIIKVLHLEGKSSNSEYNNSEGPNIESENMLNKNISRTGKESKLNSIFILSNTHSIMISILTLSILLFIFKPSIILSSTQLLSLSLFYY